ncbi:MAG: choice-of-anchor A family protein [Verrucomicrobia bacterium]|nr:choice-of-anchor A family protein [Verrucomicrobiota bacterium]
MRFKPYKLIPLLALLWVGLAGRAYGQAASAVNSYDSLVREYNLITFGDATFSNYGDTWGPIAIGGNLTLNGGAVAIHSDVSNVSSDPTLYVGGQLNLSNDVQLNNGYASTPNVTGSWTWDSVQKKLSNGSGNLYSVNSTNPLAANDPRTNPGPANWNMASMQAQAISVSSVLSGLAPTGTVGVNGQQLTFSANNPNTSGVVVFQLDAALLGSGTYNGQNISGIAFNLGADQTAVVNILNANGKTIFGNGVNFNDPGVASRLLWNISGTGSVSLGNGGQFYGSILAPQMNLSNANNTSINGQIVAASLSYSNAELHDTAFSPVGVAGVLVPEPTTYALWGAGLCALGLAVRRWRERRK